MTPKHSSWEAECRWHTVRAQQAIDEAKALRERVAKLEALVEKAYLEGWSHGAVHYGAISIPIIEREMLSDWRSLSEARTALKQGDDQ
jgi:hypothetical protein